LLNDNDISGAKWILININSSEGEHEFTMDEVEIIQNHLLSHAGEYTDVILGLGYDNSLGSSLGITLIATGFEHRDPFVKSAESVQGPKKEEKILMTLGTPEEQRPENARPVHSSDPALQSTTAPAAVVETPAVLPAPQETLSASLSEDLRPKLIDPRPAATPSLTLFSIDDAFDAPSPAVPVTPVAGPQPA